MKICEKVFDLRGPSHWKACERITIYFKICGLPHNHEGPCR